MRSLNIPPDLRRLVFNILIDNTDDHEKNDVILVREDHECVLAPAFDVLPIGKALGYQAIGLGMRGAESTIENAVSSASQYWLTARDALVEARQVAQVVQGWRAHFAAQGVPDGTLEELAQHIDLNNFRKEGYSGDAVGVQKA